MTCCSATPPLALASALGLCAAAQPSPPAAPTPAGAPAPAGAAGAAPAPVRRAGATPSPRPPQPGAPERTASSPATPGTHAVRERRGIRATRRRRPCLFLARGRRSARARARHRRADRQAVHLRRQGHNIKATVFSPQKVTVAEAYQAFLSILETNGLTVVPHGRFYKIIDSPDAKTSAPVYVAGQAATGEDRYITRLHRLRNVERRGNRGRPRSLQIEGRRHHRLRPGQPAHHHGHRDPTSSG